MCINMSLSVFTVLSVFVLFVLCKWCIPKYQAVQYLFRFRFVANQNITKSRSCQKSVIYIHSVLIMWYISVTLVAVCLLTFAVFTMA